MVILYFDEEEKKYKYSEPKSLSDVVAFYKAKSIENKTGCYYCFKFELKKCSYIKSKEFKIKKRTQHFAVIERSIGCAILSTEHDEMITSTLEKLNGSTNVYKYQISDLPVEVSSFLVLLIFLNLLFIQYLNLLKIIEINYFLKFSI